MVESKTFCRYLFFLSTRGTLIFIILSLISCANDAPKVTPTPPPTIVQDTHTPITMDVSQITCEQGLQMIAQNQVREVKIYKDTPSIPGDPDYIQEISIFLRTSQQSTNDLSTDNERVITGPLLNALKICKPQIVSAIQKINMNLPKEKQVQIHEYYVYKP